MATVMICLGIVYLSEQAPFLGAVQIFVYAGAVMMLFLFLLMLVGVDSSDSLVETIKGQRWMALVFSLAHAPGIYLRGNADTLAFVTAAVAFFASEEAGDGKEDVGKTQSLAQVLFQGANLAQQAQQKGAPTGVHHFLIEGKDYAVVAAPLPGNFADRTSGVLILSSVSDGCRATRSFSDPSSRYSSGCF